jgi:hypothetical protein
MSNLTKLHQVFTPKEINQIKQELKKSPHEDLELITLIENYLKKQRGFVSKMPEAGEKVVLLLSGGLDSIITWAFLMKELQLQVYPIIVKRRRVLIDRELVSAKYFSNIFRQKYRKFYHQPKFVKARLNSFPLSLKSISKDYWLENIYINPYGDIAINNEVIGLMSYLALIVAQYINYLSATESVKINTIFCANMPGDGVSIKSQSLTALRTTLLSLYTSTGNSKIQLIPLPIEKSFNLYHKKVEFIKWAKKNNLDIFKTWSCTKNALIHCGACISCKYRKLTLKEVYQRDKTLYYSQLRQNLINLFQSLVDKVKSLI